MTPLLTTTPTISLDTLKDNLDAATGTNHRTTPNGRKLEVFGTCPRCFDRDGCFVWLEDNHVHWFCNAACGPFTERAFFEVMGWSWDNRPPIKMVERPRPAPFGPDHPRLLKMRLTDADVQRYHDRGADKALELLSPFGFDASTVEACKIGYVKYVPTMGSLAGKCLAGITFPRYLSVEGCKPRLMGIRIRRDDSAADPLMPKYLGLGGGFVHGVYHSAVVNSPDGRYRARCIDGLFICEDEKTAGILNQAFREFPHLAAIGYTPEWSWDPFMDTIVANSAKVVIMQDFEPDKISPMGVHFNPGLDRAIKVRSLIRQRPTYILHHPVYKQLSDMTHAEGIGPMIDWLATQRECSYLF